MDQSPTKHTTSDALRKVSSSPVAGKEPKPYAEIESWLAEVIGQGAEAAHVFCDIDEAQLVYAIGSHRVELGIGSRNFVLFEIPDNPMDAPGYRVFSRKA